MRAVSFAQVYVVVTQSPYLTVLSFVTRNQIIHCINKSMYIASRWPVIGTDQHSTVGGFNNLPSTPITLYRVSKDTGFLILDYIVQIFEIRNTRLHPPPPLVLILSCRYKDIPSHDNKLFVYLKSSQVSLMQKKSHPVYSDLISGSLVKTLLQFRCSNFTPFSLKRSLSVLFSSMVSE